jgi:hypothetical protein
LIFTAEGIVLEIMEEDDGIQFLKVKILDQSESEKAINYPQLIGRIQAGDHVRLNTTALKLGLGTGGYHYVMSSQNLRATKEISPAGHIMKMRYTPLQAATGSCEEQGSSHHTIMKNTNSIEGMPVLIGELHSMVPILATYLRYIKPGIRVVYIMTDKASLPIMLSHHVRTLKKLDWLQGTITIGQAFGGDLEAVNIYTGLLAAKHILGADIAIVTMGPGIVGTGTPLGFSGMEQVEHIHAVSSMKGYPILIPRISTGDSRERHQGISHHTVSVLQHTLVPVNVPLLAGIEEVFQKEWGNRHHVLPLEENTLGDVDAILSTYPSMITSMGRGLSDDPIFFKSVAATAQLGLNFLNAAAKCD